MAGGYLVLLFLHGQGATVCQARSQRTEGVSVIDPLFSFLFFSSQVFVFEVSPRKCNKGTVVEEPVVLLRIRSEYM